ncbi:MAG: DUF3467 domain-containing protein [Thermoguttaceae bacterium]
MNRRNVLIALVGLCIGLALGQLKFQTETKTFAQGPERSQVLIDDSKVIATYANFCRITGTPEEVILDYGLNSQPFGTPTQPVAVNQRIVLNFYTAKRVLHSLEMTIQRHEAAFGKLETDVRKRMKADTPIPPAGSN